MAQEIQLMDAPVRLVTDPSEVVVTTSAGPGTAPGGGPGAAPSGGAGSGAAGSGGGGGADAGGGGGDAGGGDGGGGSGGDGGGTAAIVDVITAAQQIAPVFAVQPANENIIANDGASFTARASGYPAYQWQASPDGIAPFANITDGGIFSGATTDTLVLSNVPIEYSGYEFQCVATNAGGTDTSNVATLTVAAPADAPYIDTDPTDQTAADGGSAVFSIVAGGTAPLVYRWQVSTDGGLTWSNVLDGAPYSGATTDTLTINPVE
jgi:hypothetical protein